MDDIILRVQEPDAVTLQYVEAKLKPEVVGHATPTEESQMVTPAPGTTFSAVELDAIPPEYVKPVGTKSITENGDYDVTEFAAAHVAVPLPSGKITITENATGLNIARYAEADINVPQGVFPEGTLEITENGTDIDVTEYASVDVNVQLDSGIFLTDFQNFSGNLYPTKLIVTVSSVVGDFFGNSSGKCNNALSNITDVYIPYMTHINRSVFCGLKSLKSLYLPVAEAVLNYAFSQATALETIRFGAQKVNMIYYSFGNSNAVKQMIFDGDIAISAWNQPFGDAQPPIELYDFSHVTAVFTLSAVNKLPHANGCVIRLPQSLLTDFQNATNWNALTDVTWEGV